MDLIPLQLECINTKFVTSFTFKFLLPLLFTLLFLFLLVVGVRTESMEASLEENGSSLLVPDVFEFDDGRGEESETISTC